MNNMFNLLPDQEKEKIFKQYTMRKYTIAFGFLLFVVIASAIFLLPSYILTLYREIEVKKDLEAVKKSIETKDSGQLNETFSQINKKIKSISFENQLIVYQEIEKILNVKPQHVSISAFLIQETAYKKYKIQLSGISQRREQLVSFRDALVSSKRYESVELPVSSLANNSDADYTLNLTISL